MRDDVRSARIEMWKPVREVFEAAEALFEDAGRLRSAAEAEPAPVRGKPGAPPPPPGVSAAYLRRRQALREAIEVRLDPVLIEQLGPWQKHVCVVAIVSYLDERERLALGGLVEPDRLVPIQRELLGIDDGGDRFFQQLQELLARADVHELVFEIHLLCLRAGFVGRYRDRRHELDKLIGWVVDRLRYYRPPPAAPLAAPDAPRRNRVGFVHVPVRYYVGVALLVVAIFAALRIVSEREVAHSNLAEYCHYHDGDTR